MMKQLFTIIIVTFIILFTSLASAKEKKGHIIIIDSYTSSTPWGSMIATDILSKPILKKHEIGVTIRYFRDIYPTTVDNIKEIVSKFTADIEQKDPTLLVFIGVEAFSYFREFADEKLHSYPIVLFSMVDYYAPISYYLEKKAVGHDDKIAISSLLDSYNMSVVLTPPALEETVQMIKSIQPNVETLHYLSDSRYISAQFRSDFADIIKQNHSELSLHFIMGGAREIDHILKTLRTLTFPKHAILYHSLSTTDTVSDDFMSKWHTVISTVIDMPIYALHELGVIGKDGMFANYRYDMAEFSQNITNLLEDSFDNGDIAEQRIIHPTKYSATVNYPLLEKYKINENSLPKNSIYYLKPPPFVIAYRTELAIGVLLLIIIVVLTVVLLRKKYSEVSHLKEYFGLVNNMPIMYVKLRKNKPNSPFKYDFVAKNRAYDELISSRTERGEEIYSQEFRDKVVEILDRNEGLEKGISFEYFNKNKSVGCKVVIKQSADNECYDIFALDTSDLMTVMEHLKVARHKFQVVLEISEITACSFDYENQTIEFDDSSVERGTVKVDFFENSFTINGMPFLNFVHPDHREMVNKASTDIRNGELGNIKLEYMIRDIADNGWRWIENFISVLESDENRKAKVVVSATRNITARKQFEADILNAKTLAERADKLKSDFISNMNHEIRTPLNAIVGFANLMVDEQSLKDRRNYSRIVESNSDTLLSIMSNVIVLSEIESLGFTMNPTCLDAVSLLKEVVVVAKSKMINNNITISIESQESSCWFLSDRSLLYVVVDNLVSNATKFTERGSISVGVKIIENREVQLYVKDSGIGIPTKDIDNVFERFYKCNSFSQGTGLGLSICKSIAEKLGGNISVSSTEGVGSEFYFTFKYEECTPKYK